jgi:hypothetical protein
VKKVMLFRLHRQNDEKYVKEIIEFVKGYFEMQGKRVKLSFEEFKGFDGLGSAGGKMFDLFIETSDQSEVDVAHACAWSYVTAKGV